MQTSPASCHSGSDTFLYT